MSHKVVSKFQHFINRVFVFVNKKITNKGKKSLTAFLVSSLYETLVHWLRNKQHSTDISLCRKIGQVIYTYDVPLSPRSTI